MTDRNERAYQVFSALGAGGVQWKVLVSGRPRGRYMLQRLIGNNNNKNGTGTAFGFNMRWIQENPDKARVIQNYWVYFIIIAHYAMARNGAIYVQVKEIKPLFAPKHGYGSYLRRGCLWVQGVPLLGKRQLSRNAWSYVVTRCRFRTSPTPRWSVSCIEWCKDATVRVWNPQTGSLMRTLNVYGDGVCGVSVSPDSRLVACGTKAGL